MTRKTKSEEVDKIDSKQGTLSLEKILDYRARGLTYEEIGKLHNISRQAVHQRIKPHIDAIESLPAFKENRADILAMLQRKILSTLTEEDIKKSSLRDRIISAGILHDKEKTERGLTPRDAERLIININFDPNLIPGNKGKLQIKPIVNELDNPDDVPQIPHEGD